MSRTSLRRGRALLALLALLLPVLGLVFLPQEPQKPAQPARAADTPVKLELRKGDHISIVGNTLADRMQHDGWLETLIQSRFPKHELSFRNLGFSGDELTQRIRSKNFGTPEEWLTQTKADVVFAFFGYNESFAGKDGLDKFKTDLADFIRKTTTQRYNGKSSPQLVIFSPIAHEDHRSPNLPDGKENNERLALYTQAMSEIAKAHRVVFVDLFTPSQTLYARAKKPLTINGVHLTEDGNRQVAEVIDKALFGDDVRRDVKLVERLRQAVVDKDFYWFNRYRTTDGFSIYGDRAYLKFVGGQTNREVMAREMEVLDVMTANRDKRVWSVAQGGDLQPDDGNTPAFIPVETNKPGKGPNGRHLFLDGEDAIGSMKVAEGLKVNLFASEKQFKELVNPVQMSWDPKGRLWVAVWPTYPHWKPKEEMNDKILILEDTDGDGKADKVKTFADKLHNPTGFELWNGGVLVAMAPDLLFLKDTDGDDVADVRQRVIHGLCSADTHHTANSFVLDPGGALYFQEGTFHRSQVESPYGPCERLADAGVFRYEPRTQKFEVYVSFGFANPHGHVFDRWGQDIVVDGTGSQPYHAALFSGRLEYPNKHKRPPQVYQQWTRPCPGMEYLSSKHFPPQMQGNLIVANVIGYQGLLQYKIEDKDASFTGTEQERLLSSTDANFRPSDLKVGPDGALYFIDWHNPIIGHMQHNLRDPSRDREHGRVYRVTYEGRPLSKPARIAGEPIEKLLELLKEPEDRVRSRTRIELSARDSGEVAAAAKKWIAGLDSKDKDYEHHRLEGLWLHQAHNKVDIELLKKVLASPNFQARAAATRVLCYWRDRVPEALDLLRTLAADDHPRVRLEAVRAASFFKVPEAVEIALIVEQKPGDQYLDFTRGETLRALEPYVKQAIASGKAIDFKTPAGARFFLKNVATDDLLKMKRAPGVYLEMLFRPGVRDEVRREALTGLAKADSKSELRVLVDTIRNHDEQQNSQDASVVFDLVRLLTSRPASELTSVRTDLEKLATGGKSSLLRELGYVALIAADGSPDRAWTLAVKDAGSLLDLVSAMPLVRDPGQKAALYPKIEPLLQGLPKELGGGSEGKDARGRYVRIELPGKMRTLTLAEVQVFSQGKNVARQGKARQNATAHGGSAEKAIDGNTSGSYSDGSSTHTPEGQPDPWWEVDLGGEYPIQSIVIFNRTDGNLGTRLKNFTVTVLDRNRNAIYEKKQLPTPTVSTKLEVATESKDRVVRRAAMTALTSVRGKELETFQSLARFLRDDTDRNAAVQAILRIPVRDWPKDDAKVTVDLLLGYIRKLPVSERTTPEALDMIQLADNAAGLLPPDQAKAARKELGELGVRVLRIGTVHDQMLFDKERLVVQAGKTAEIYFQNTDIMPHNLVLIQPGSLEEIGNQAEQEATQPGALERHYVPQSNKVLLKSRLLQPREEQKISFTAPKKAGVYPYVCTYPGHWRRMHGAMYVVDNLEEYQADPEAYLAKNPLPIADELLKYNRPRKEWKLEDLTPLVEKMKDGRNYKNAKLMFTVANCVACHKFDGAGTEMGPDLTKPDPKLTKLDILKEIVDPSARINDKYYTYVFELKSGKVITGMILEETKETVKVVENPLAKSQPVVIKLSDVDNRIKSPNSMMPKGLLDKLTQEEILDLVAYILAKGDGKDKLFQGGDHDHQHHGGH